MGELALECGESEVVERRGGECDDDVTEIAPVIPVKTGINIADYLFI